MSYKLFLDDERQPEQVTWVSLYVDDEPFVIVRNVQEFIDTITARGLPYFIAFDHDLGYPDTRTGLDAAKWLTNYCQVHGKLVPSCVIHSFNPDGARAIRQHIDSYLLSQV